MLHLLKIDLKKMTSYRTFWVVCGLYFLTLGFGAASGMEFLKWLANLLDNFDQKLNISRIPLYHFPDVWMNLIWFGGLLKVVLAIMVVISITNEFTYRTLRQNIIDGLSRTEFLVSKILNQFPYLSNSHRIETIGRLIKNQYRWIIEQCRCNSQPLLHPQRVCFVFVISAIGQFNKI